MPSVYRELLFKSGQRAAIVIREKTLLRLDTTCFRGARLGMAGNFSRWSRADEFLDDAIVLAQLSASLSEAFVADEFGTHSVTLEYATDVGWAGTAPLGDFFEGSLEEFQPNRRSTALRIRRNLVHLRAPRTSKITVVFELKLEDSKPVLVIHSIYPGDDIGELDGDITAREKVVFFSFEHPGADI